ncbi:hypothetical protein F66182_15037, partial [Fusarium sp. NRRL 66182]
MVLATITTTLENFLNPQGNDIDMDMLNVSGRGDARESETDAIFVDEEVAEMGAEAIQPDLQERAVPVVVGKGGVPRRAGKGKVADSWDDDLIEKVQEANLKERNPNHGLTALKPGKDIGQSRRTSLFSVHRAFSELKNKFDLSGDIWLQDKYQALCATLERTFLFSSQTSLIDQHLQNNDLPEPSFDQNGPTEPIQNETLDIQKAKTDVIEATIELRQLLEGPMKLVLPEVCLYHIPLFNHADHQPNSLISFSDLATKCSLLEHDLKRIIRYAAIHHRVFIEPTKGFVAHTAASRLMAENPVAGHLLSLTFDECWPAHNHAVEAISQRSTLANISGYAIANNTGPLNTFQYLSKHKERATSFAFSMGTTSKASLDALSIHFPWSDLCTTQDCSSLVVDVGGSKGHVSLHLARIYPDLKFIVQDLQEVIDGAADHLISLTQDSQDAAIKDRIEFAPHDMFEEQPVKNSDVYLLRYVLHDWGD